MNPMLNDTSKCLAQAIQKLKGIYSTLEIEKSGEIKETIDVLELALEKIVQS